MAEIFEKKKKSRKIDFWDREKFYFFFKGRNFLFKKKNAFLPLQGHSLSILQGGDASSPQDLKIYKQTPWVTFKESKVKQTALFVSLN